MPDVATHHDFALPLGYLDRDGVRHVEGTIRLATAHDEIEALADPRAQHNEARLATLRLARTVERIGAITDVTPELIERLFAADFDHLRGLYLRLNTSDGAIGGASRSEGPELDEPNFVEQRRVDPERVDAERVESQPAEPEVVMPAGAVGLGEVSDDAARWLTRGEVPPGLVPLLGDPTFDAREPDDERRTGDLADAPPPIASGGFAQIVEGIGEATAANGPRSGDTTADLARPSGGPPPARATIDESTGLARDRQQLLRLARTPSRAATLASLTGGELTDDGSGTSTVTFALGEGEGSSGRTSETKARTAPAAPTPPAAAPTTGQASTHGNLDDAYEGFVRRLRRELLRDREWIGDLLGPLR